MWLKGALLYPFVPYPLPLSVGAAEASSFTCMVVQGSRLPFPNPPLPRLSSQVLALSLGTWLRLSSMFYATEYQGLSPTFHHNN